MDKRITARFFQIENAENGNATFFDCLHQLWADEGRENWVEVSDGVRVRLLRFRQAPDDDRLVEGEFIRQQRDNVPPIAPDEGPLRPQDQPIGHRCAFRYYAEHSILLLESRREAVTTGRVDRLIKAEIRRHRGFFLSPVLTEDALQRLRHGNPRTIEFRVARPSDIATVEGNPLEVEDNLRRLQNHFQGPNVEVKISWPRGNQNGRLSKNAVNQFIRWATGNQDHMEKLRVKISEESEPIDLLAEQIKVSADMELSSEIEENYEQRRVFLRDTFLKYMSLIDRLYGDD